MGLAGCPASFARMMDMIMRGLANVITYIDDLLVHSKTYGEHLHHLEQVFVRLRAHNLKLNLEKCDFASAQVNHLGHTLTPTGVSPGLEKTKAILEAKPPTSVKEVKSFLGLCNYFRSYIEHFATIAAPMHYLTSNESQWKKGEMPADAAAAFKLLQGKLTSTPVMKYPDQKGRLHLFVDAAGGTNGKGGAWGPPFSKKQKMGLKDRLRTRRGRLKFTNGIIRHFCLNSKRQCTE
jgi:hypothetical protein